MTPRTRGCGHGECTTADTPCRYETGLAGGLGKDASPAAIGLAMNSAPAGGTAEVWLRMNGATQPDGVRWTTADLDRCEHGRHSIDHCFDCPKPTNRFLMAPSTIPVDERVRHHDGIWEVRIGTMVRGEPIWVVVRDRPREQTDGN